MKTAAPVASCRVALLVECKESRIGKLPVPVPKGVTVTIENNKVTATVRRLKRSLSETFEGKLTAAGHTTTGPEG